MKRKSEQPRFSLQRTHNTEHKTTWIEGIAPPHLWNPSAAVNWSLLFTPVFGAILHMKNWRALGETEKAEICKAWAILNFAIILGLSLMAILQPFDSAYHGHLLRNLGLVLLPIWYIGNAREQTGYVKSRFGETYQRRDWLVPSLLAMLGLTAYIMAIYVLSRYFIAS